VRSGRRGAGARWTALVFSAVVCAVAQADQPEPPSSSAPLTFSVSPFVGYRFGGTFTLAGTDTHVDVNSHAAYALALDLSTDGRDSQYELFYSRQSTSLGAQSPVPSNVVVEYLHIGGTTVLGDSSSPRLRPYLAGSLGVTRFDPSLGDHKTDFSASLGLGVRSELTRHLDVRLEARGFATVLSSSSAVFCRSDETGGLCQIQGRGSTFLQADILAGVSYSF
jgi:hypothetical protein